MTLITGLKSGLQIKSFARIAFGIFVTLSVSSYTAIALGSSDVQRVEISLPTAILFALDNNPDIDVSKERQNQAKFAIDEAKAALYPQVDVNVEYGPEYNRPAANVEDKKSDVSAYSKYSVLARQLIFDGSITTENIKRRKQEKQSTEIQTDIEYEKAISDTIRIYINILNLQKTVAENRKLINNVQEIFEKVQVQFDAGAASQAKLDYAKSRVSFAKTQLNDSVSGLNDEISNLEFLTGRLPPFVASYPEFLDPSNYDLKEYIDYGLQNNSELVLNDSDKRVLDHRVASERGRYYPSVNFQAEAEKRHEDGGDISPIAEVKGYFQMSYTLFDGGARKAAVSRFKSQSNEVEIQKAKIQKEITRDIKQAYNQLTSLQEAIRVTEEEIESSRSLQNLNRENFELGSIDIIELIEGEERLNAAILKKSQLVSDLYLNTYQLLIQIGYLKKNYFCNSC